MRQVKPREGRGLPKTHSRARLSAQVTPGPAGVWGGAPEQTRAPHCSQTKGWLSACPSCQPTLEAAQGKAVPKGKKATWSCCHHKMALFCGARGFAVFVRSLRGGTAGISSWGQGKCVVWVQRAGDGLPCGAPRVSVRACACLHVWLSA